MVKKSIQLKTAMHKKTLNNKSNILYQNGEFLENVITEINFIKVKPNSHFFVYQRIIKTHTDTHHKGLKYCSW